MVLESLYMSGHSTYNVYDSYTFKSDVFANIVHGMFIKGFDGN